DSVHIEWKVTNRGTASAQGSWTDTVYLSSDDVWDIHDTMIGRIAHSGDLLPGQSYIAKLDGSLPIARPERYRLIVRTDIFDEVYEGPGEANNPKALSTLLTLTVPKLDLDEPLPTSLSTGQERLFQIDVEAGQTLQFDLTPKSLSPETVDAVANVIAVRFGD